MSGSKADLFREMFFEEARELLTSLEQGLADPGRAGADRACLDRLYRAAHSLKGAAAMVGFAAISERALAMEKALGQVRTGAAPWTDDLAQIAGRAARGAVGPDRKRGAPIPRIDTADRSPRLIARAIRTAGMAYRDWCEG